MPRGPSRADLWCLSSRCRPDANLVTAISIYRLTRSRPAPILARNERENIGGTWRTVHRPSRQAGGATRPVPRAHGGRGRGLCPSQPHHPAAGVRRRVLRLLPCQSATLPGAGDQRAWRAVAADARRRFGRPHRPLAVSGLRAWRRGRAGLGSHVSVARRSGGRGARLFVLFRPPAR